MSSKVVWKDLGLKKILSLQKKLDGSVVNIGYDDTVEATKAMVNNYGSPSKNIPARPFMSRAAKKIKKSEMSEHINDDIVEKKTYDLEQVGKDGVKVINKEITSGRYIPKKSGKGRTLIENGDMLRATTYWIDE